MADPLAATQDDAKEWSFSPGEITLTNTVLGRGAFGEVRVAKWRNIDVACKSLHAVEPNNEESIDRDNLSHEILMLSKLRHPNLVLFLGVCHGLVNGTTSILTELLPCSLYDLLEVKKSVLSLPDILDIGLDVAYGLDYLHKHIPQIVHRDISSKNILIGGNRAKIADLGQAKLFGHNTLSHQTGMPGAMAYSAPEVLTGKYSAKIDVFSFGVLLAQMCTGQYPRIDRREEQITQACDAQPVFRDMIVNSVHYQPHERPTSELICQGLEAVKANDRYYPVSRTVHPEKDLGVLGWHWMQSQIDRRCETVLVELHRTKSLLAAEEARWQHEAGRVDGINAQLRESQTQHVATMDQLTRLRSEHEDLQRRQRDTEALAMQLRAQLGTADVEMARMQGNINLKDTQIAQQLDDIIAFRDALGRYQDDFHLASQQLEASRRSESDLLKRNEQLKLQLDMQVEYVRDLEARLEQALTRWKLEKDALREEKARYGKLNTHSASIVATNEKQKQDIARYEARLAQYADLPVPEELKERFKDMQDDVQLARDEVSSLLRQRDEWMELKATLDQTIDDFNQRAQQHAEQSAQHAADMRRKEDEVQRQQAELRDAALREKERTEEMSALAAQVAEMRDAEVQLNDTLRQTRVALTREKARLEMYQNATANAAAPVAAGASSRSSRPRPVTMDGSAPQDNEEEEDTEQQEAVVEEAPQVRPDSPYILQQEIRPNLAPGGQVTDLDDEDAMPAIMRTLVPSVARLAHIEAVQATFGTEDVRTDIGLKHMVNAAAEKEGAQGLMRVMLQDRQEERVVWRGARALREIILKDEAAKQQCYDANIETWLIAMINFFPSSVVVQGHCMRLVGALAFGNDRFRRKAGEQGIMAAISHALEKHAEDETVMLHVCTAITNLTHNSLENRSRFLESRGVEPFIAVLVRFKESAKLQRQACWAVLSLCGTDEISRTIALRGGDSAILNAMLYHRFDAGVQQFGCWALSNLALSGEEIMRKMKKKGAVEVCRIAMETHPKNAEVVRQARNAIGAFSPLGPPSQATGTASSHPAGTMMHSASQGVL